MVAYSNYEIIRAEEGGELMGEKKSLKRSFLSFDNEIFSIKSMTREDGERFTT